jgi:Lipase maturation factor
VFRVSDCLQAILISSGNLSFLNHLTILPGIFCLDDDVLKWLFSRKVWDQVVALRVAATPPVSPVDTQQCAGFFLYLTGVMPEARVFVGHGSNTILQMSLRNRRRCRNKQGYDSEDVVLTV